MLCWTPHSVENPRWTPRAGRQRARREIARWPARFKPSTKFIDTPAHFIDMMAACVDAGAATYPSEGNVIPMQGRSLLPLIAYDCALYREHEGNCCARRGKWKLVRKFPGDWELYDMDVDRTELHDLASTEPKPTANNLVPSITSIQNVPIPSAKWGQAFWPAAGFRPGSASGNHHSSNYF